MTGQSRAYKNVLKSLKKKITSLLVLNKVLSLTMLTHFKQLVVADKRRPTCWSSLWYHVSNYRFLIVYELAVWFGHDFMNCLAYDLLFGSMHKTLRVI